MARSRRKNGGPTRGRFKPKKLGKGYVTHRRKRGAVKPLVRKAEDATPAQPGA
ncbi:MAG: hypothetical protein IT458_10625 [Planctomycetes bacterium]|nr:hypothetical protein [Planctomycetota bacterium]